MGPRFPQPGASDFGFENLSPEGRALLFAGLILQGIRQHRLTIPYRQVYAAQHQTPRRRSRSRINKRGSKVSKDQNKNGGGNRLERRNDPSVSLQLLANPFDDRPRLAENLIIEGNQAKLSGLTLSLGAEHEVKGRSDRLTAI